MKHIRRRKPTKWPLLLIGQWVLFSLATAGALALSLSLEAPPVWAYQGVMWGLLPVIGAASAYFITVKNVNNYLAWLAPPVLMTGVHWLLLGYPPGSAGMPLVAALLSLVAAAAGEVQRQRAARAKHK